MWWMRPDSFSEHSSAILAADATSRASGRALKTMWRWLKEGRRVTLVPQALYDQVRLDVSLTSAPRWVA